MPDRSVSSVRAGILVASLAAVGVLTWILFGRETRTHPAGAERPLPPRTSEPKAPTPPEMASGMEVAERSEASLGEKRLHGLVVWRDGAGAPNGELRLSWGDGGRQTAEVAVQDGRWSLHAEPIPATLLVHELSLDGVRASADPAIVQVAPGEPVVIHALRGRTDALRVFDRTDGRELEAATMIVPFRLASQAEATLETHPGGQTNHLSRTTRSTPVGPAELAGVPALIVGSPGYSWSVITNFAGRLQPPIALVAPAGDLHLIRSAPSTESGVLQLWRASNTASMPSYAFRLEPDFEGVVLGGIVASEYVARLVPKSSGANSCAFRTWPLVVPRGQTVVLDVSNADGPSNTGVTSVAGSILHPAREDGQSIHTVVLTPLEVTCVSPLPIEFRPEFGRSSAGGLELIEWAPLPMASGLWRLTTAPPWYCMDVEVPATDFFVLECMLPELVQVDVSFLDPSSGESVDVAWFTFACAGPDGVSSRSPLPLSGKMHTPEGQTTRVWVHRGRTSWTVATKAGGYGHVDVPVEKPGPLVVPVEGTRLLRLESRSFGEPIDLPMHAWTTLIVRDAESGETVLRTVAPLELQIEGRASRAEALVSDRKGYVVDWMGRSFACTPSALVADQWLPLDVTGLY